MAKRRIRKTKKISPKSCPVLVTMRLKHGYEIVKRRKRKTKKR